MNSWNEALSRASREMQARMGEGETQRKDTVTRLWSFLDKCRAVEKLEDVKSNAWGSGEIVKLLNERVGYSESFSGGRRNFISGAIEASVQLYYPYQDVREIIEVVPPRGLFSADRLIHTGKYKLVSKVAALTIGVANVNLEGQAELNRHSHIKGGYSLYVHYASPCIDPHNSPDEWGIARGLNHYISLPKSDEEINEFIVRKIVSTALNPYTMPPAVEERGRLKIEQYKSQGILRV